MCMRVYAISLSIHSGQAIDDRSMYAQGGACCMTGKIEVALT